MYAFVNGELPGTPTVRDEVPARSPTTLFDFPVQSVQSYRLDLPRNVPRLVLIGTGYGSKCLPPLGLAFRPPMFAISRCGRSAASTVSPSPSATRICALAGRLADI